MSYYNLNVDCWSYNTAITARFCFALIFKVSTPPPPPVALPREICTECFERLLSNILQCDKMLHFLYFVYIFILIPLTKGSICY